MATLHRGFNYERPEKDSEREERIADEIIVDAYNEEECAMGWYYYLENMLEFPFKAVCLRNRSISILKEGEKVTVLGMADEEECSEEMFALVRWKKHEVAVPLAQLQPIGAGEDTVQAVEDWHYWVARGHGF